MPWTESSTREEWLAEVRRRGERIRRRRRAALSAVCALALLGPAFAMVSRTAGDGGDRQLQVAARGPAPASGATGTSVPATSGDGEAIPTTTALAGVVALPEVTAPSGPLYSSTTTVVPRRDSSVSSSVPPADDPVVRPTSTTTLTPTPPPDGRVGSAQANSAGPASPVTTALSAVAGPPACPTGEVEVTVTVDRRSYAPGETVTWSSTLQNKSSTTCLMSGRAFFHVEDTAGNVVGSFPYTANYMAPVKAEPGRTITNTGRWDQLHCSGPCTQVPPGSYVVVAGWTEGGPWVGRGSFQIDA